MNNVGAMGDERMLLLVVAFNKVLLLLLVAVAHKRPPRAARQTRRRRTEKSGIKQQQRRQLASVQLSRCFPAANFSARRLVRFVLGSAALRCRPPRAPAAAI